MPRHANSTSFKPGRRRPLEEIEKQRRTVAALAKQGKWHSLKGRHLRPESIENIRRALTGRRMPPEAIEKQRQSLRARPVKCVLCGESFVRNSARQRYCKACVPSATYRARVGKYGIGKPQWEEMLKRQNGLCALCTNEPDVVDHNHLTGRVRGLLCHGCNIRVAALDCPGWLEGALRYVRGDDS